MPTRHQRYRSLLLPRSDDGLGLAEMIVAITVIMVVLVSAGAAFVRMGQAQRFAEGADRGTQMIQDRLETIRKLPYNKVGCYGDDNPCPTKAPVTNPVNTSNGELVINLGLKRPVTSDPDDPTIPTNTSETVGGNVYTVTTVITWAGVTSAPAGYPADLTKAPYAAKRVTVTAKWDLGATTRSVTRQWLRSPSTTELIPPTAGADGGSRCAEETPYCTISITEGQVFATPAGQLSNDVEFTAQLLVKADSATVKVGSGTLAVTHPLTVLNGGVTNNGYTLTYVAPKLSTIPGVTPGPNMVTFTVFTFLGDVAVNKMVSWRFAVAPDYELADLHGVATIPADTTVDPLAAPPTGAEPTASWFCVNNVTNALLRYTAVIFDRNAAYPV